MDPLFIVIDGADGVGTTTASKGLVQVLNEAAIQAVWTKEPSDGIIGRHIRKILKGEELADEAGMFPLFLADRWDHISNFIRPHLEQGETVVCDRYYPSTWVYQQDNYPAEIIEFMHRKILAPNYVFILTCPPEIAAERMKKRDVKERYDSNELQERYAERYSRFSRPSYFIGKSGGIYAPMETGGKVIPTVGAEEIYHISTINTQPADVVADMLRIIRQRHP
jgi:dTMP kinase